ncbi:hypothetical protein ABZS86_11405 [Streptomyces sp. NPDC005355]|uniref:hypothetical protein n=1 Tax=Streptomyces sp. NPDC005355 TaxID=3157038 RepID=UPI0033BD73FF
MSSYEIVDVKERGAPVWWAMVKTASGPVPVRVESWTLTEAGVSANLATLRGVDSSPGNVIELRLMTRDEGWAQVAAWSKSGGSS